MISFPFILSTVVQGTNEIRGDIGIPRSAEHRIQLWLGYVDPIQDNFLIGSGAKANRVLATSGEYGDFAAKAGFRNTSTHPHNFILEFWVDFGLIGILLCCSLVLAITALVSKLDSMSRNLTMSLMVAGIAYSFSGAGFMQAWWLAAICMAATAWGSIYISSRR